MPIDNLTDESGDEGSFSIVMNSKPSDFVDLVLTSSDLTEGSVQATVTFSPLNWNIPQIITVTGLPDPVPHPRWSYKLSNYYWSC